MDNIELIRNNIEKAVADGDTRSLQIWLNAYTALAKETEKLDVQKENNDIQKERNKIDKEIELNKLGLEQRKFEAEQKCSKFNKGVTIAEKVIGFIQAVADIGQGFVAPIVNLKTAKINAEQKKLCTKMITDIEKDGDIPYQQATKHHTW